MATSTLPFPDVDRQGVGVVLVSTRYVGSVEAQQAEVARVLKPYTRAGSIPGLVSMNAFVSTEGQNVLTYAQWRDDEDYRSFVRDGGLGDLDPDAAEPIRYRPYRGRVLEPQSTARVLVAPMFDVDGRDRQRASADALIDGPLGTPFPGLVGSHFHHSDDGSRVLNWAEWTTEDAHARFMDSPRPYECMAALEMPGVRGIGGRRYVLADSVVV